MIARAVDDTNRHLPRMGWRRGVAVVALGLGLAYLPTWGPLFARAVEIELPGQGPVTALWLNWAAVGLLLFFVSFVERRPLSSLLLTRPRRADLKYAVLFWGVTTAFAGLLSFLLPPPRSTGYATITALPVLALAALVVTTAVTEEILMRAYPIERLTDVTGHRWIGVAVSATVFVAPHLIFFGPSWILYQGLGVLAAYTLYLWRRNLYACMLLHLLGNAPILIPTILG